MRNDRLTQGSSPTIEDFFELVAAIRQDIQRQHEQQLVELAAIKTELKELEKKLGRAESTVVTAPTNVDGTTGSSDDTTLQAQEPLPTLLRVETPHAQDPMAGERKSRLGRLYTKYLKRIGILRFLWDLIGRKIYLFFKKYSHMSLSSWRAKIQGRPIVKLSTRAENSTDGVHRYAAAESVDAPVPAVFPGQDRGYLSSPLGKYIFPEIFVTTVHNALVTGGTNMILASEEVLCHDLYDFVRDSTSEELHGRAAINPKTMRVRWLANSPESEVLPVASAFVDACAHNYSHWLTEVLPRVSLFCSDDRHRDVPIIVNEGLHNNIMASLSIVAGLERMILLLPVGRAVRVERLLTVSPTAYVPFDRRSHEIDGHLQGQFSPFAIGFLRKTIMNSLKNTNSHFPKKIVIRRNSGTRILLNGENIERQLVARGFAVVEPEKLSFREQVQLFSNAETVVGPTGAALANIVFCQPSARIVVMIAKHESMPYWYWQNMAHSVGCRVHYVLGNIIRKAELGIHGDFHVDPGAVFNAIETSV